MPSTVEIVAAVSVGAVCLVVIVLGFMWGIRQFLSELDQCLMDDEMREGFDLSNKEVSDAGVQPETWSEIPYWW